MITSPRQFDHTDITQGAWDGAQWTFSCSMGSACAPAFDHCDSNYDVEDELKTVGVIHPKNSTDSESCQMFVYFSSKKAGLAFIDRLNNYLEYLHEVPVEKVRAVGFKAWKADIAKKERQW